MIDLINALPDALRMTDAVYLTIRIVASILGYTFWEDGSVS